ncbi:MAG: hypothetical protein JRG73_14285 [Deltaproteobacteria bacterium]|nr:hypothetical protein [Deltaproteobacteria bacterium]MBW2308091.1 hypothetical protein [Deltaproteobacteria bacterium]
MSIDLSQRARPTIRIFTAEQSELLHMTAMEIMERTGVLFFKEESLELLKKTG